MEPESSPLKAKVSLLRAQGSAQQHQGPEHVTAPGRTTSPTRGCAVSRPPTRRRSGPCQAPAALPCLSGCEEGRGLVPSPGILSTCPACRDGLAPALWLVGRVASPGDGPCRCCGISRCLCPAEWLVPGPLGLQWGWQSGIRGRDGTQHPWLLSHNLCEPQETTSPSEREVHGPQLPGSPFTLRSGLGVCRASASGWA